jgi:hypothetical protein
LEIAVKKMLRGLGSPVLVFLCVLLLPSLALASGGGEFHANHTMELIATILFGLAVVHTFTVKRFQHLAHKYPEGSIPENLFHLLGEVEVVFGLWAAALVAGIIVMSGNDGAIAYLESRNYTEPAFVFVIMAMAATRPVIQLAGNIIGGAAKFLPMNNQTAFYLSALILGPLLGSFITEPAAMTVTALILLDRYYSGDVSKRFKYATLGVLFVNVSIGGTLTHFAAPPVLMVAGKWGWGMEYMAMNFGWKAAVAVVINAAVVTAVLKKELGSLVPAEKAASGLMKMPVWLYVVHIVFMGGVVFYAHHMVFFLGLFLFFLGFVQVTGEYQQELDLKGSLLVGFFLAGLVTLGGLQSWWLQPLLSKMDSFPLFLGSTGLTAITDNAALTYLGSLVEGLSDASKHALVAGAVAGGGLTVIANAPNPAGYSILQKSFGEEGISPMGLLLYALPPTIVAMVCLWVLPSL